MNKNSIKKFAIEARRDLIARVSQRAALFEITDQGYGDPSADSVLGTVMSAEQKKQRQALIARIREKGYEQVMEEIAYTWFNRFIALRFMEVNGYLPSRVRVFTDDQNAFKPQILVEAIDMELEGLDMQKVYAFKNANDNDGLFKYMIITQCNALSAVLPGMFQHISDYTELLFPDHLLWEDSVIDRMISMIPEEDWTDQVQIIGWLYQYYNTEPKDKVFENLKKNIKISKENIPAATQLFTPDWIVRYMVENSLGRIAINARMSEEYHISLSETERQAEEKALAESYGFRYYLPEAPQTPEVRQQLTTDHYPLPTTHCPLPTNLKCIDPCMGSGHILCYMFDVLVKLYESFGYTSRDAVASIIENNLYGLDIDERAAQLAYFAVMMKARQYDRRFFSRGLRPHIHGFRESNGMNRDYLELFGSLKPTALKLCENFRDAMEYGSIIDVDLTADELAALRERYDAIAGEHYGNIFDSIRQNGLVNEFCPLLELAETLAQKYDAVITNPPYMGASGMGGKLSEFVKKYFPDSKSDMSTVCMEKCLSLCNINGFMAMINIPVWMFLSSYEKLRHKLYASSEIINMVHPGRGIFGSDFGTTTFVFKKGLIKGYQGSYRRLFEKQGDVEANEVREKAFLSGKGQYIANQGHFEKIPGAPVAYWVSSNVLNTFKNGALSQIADVKKGMSTADDERFLRIWHEVSQTKVGEKWYRITKGGDYRKWYGNRLYYVNWANNGAELRAFPKSVLRNVQYYFAESICWNYITVSKISFKYYEDFAYTAAAPCIQSKNHLLYILGFGNSCVANILIMIIGGSTVTFEVGEVGSLPLIISNQHYAEVTDIVARNIQISRADWDSYEISWDFKRHPLV